MQILRPSMPLGRHNVKRITIPAGGKNFLLAKVPKIPIIRSKGRD